MPGKLPAPYDKNIGPGSDPRPVVPLGSAGMDELVVRHAGAEDRGRITELLMRSWGGTTVVAHGVKYDAADLPALLAERADRVAGLLTYAIGVDGFEVVTLDAVERHA